MTDQEIEQARKELEPPLEPLYVDSRAKERNDAILAFLLETSWLDTVGKYIVDSALNSGIPYEGRGTLIAPFVTLEEARAVQKPGQSIIISGYATIGAAVPKTFTPAQIPDNIKKRCG